MLVQQSEITPPVTPPPPPVQPPGGYYSQQSYLPPAPTPQKSRKKGIGSGWALINLIIVSVTGVILMASVMASLSGIKKTTTTTPQPSNNAPAVQSTQTLSEASQVQKWFVTYGPILTTLSDDLHTLGNDATNVNMTAVVSDAQKLRADLLIAKNYPAIPSAQAASDFKALLSAFFATAQDAIDGVNSNDSSLIKRAIGECNEGNTYIKKVVYDITSVIGRVPVTNS